MQSWRLIIRMSKLQPIADNESFLIIRLIGIMKGKFYRSKESGDRSQENTNTGDRRQEIAVRIIE